MIRPLKVLFLTLGALTFMTSAQAAEPYTYKPEYCEFEITFPEKPVIRTECDDEAKTRCYELVTFNQVFDLMATTRFKVICNAINEDIKANYSDETIIATLEAMTKNSVVETFDRSVQNADGYKLAGLVGEGRAGLAPTIFIAQLWIGDISAFSLEAELLGEAYRPADELFRDVLSGIKYVGIPGLNKASQNPEPPVNDSTPAQNTAPQDKMPVSDKKSDLKKALEAQE